MTLIKTLLIATAATISFAANASASEPTFSANFTFDKTANVQAQYKEFQTQAKTICRKEIRKAGYRSTSRMQRKCERELLSRAVAATKSNLMLAQHETRTNKAPKFNTRNYASK